MKNNHEFRAWDKDNLAMYFSDGTNCDDGEWGKKWVIDEDGIHFEEYWLSHHEEGGEIIERESWRIPNQVIMGYTSLCDANGKKIYDKDIVKSPYGLCIIEWSEAAFMIRRVVSKLWHEHGETVLRSEKAKKIEVIGNAFQNPELLGGEK